MRLITSLAVLFVSFQNLDCHNSYSRKLNSRLNFFDIELLRAATEDKKGNVMVSPASIKSTLAMILAGAIGITEREIEEALRVSSVKDELTEHLHLYLTALRANTTAVLQNANGIFVSKKLKLNPKYESDVKRYYLSEVTSLDFNDPGAAAIFINNWISENTHGLIPFVVEPAHVTPRTDLIIANALFFKSTWHHAFNPDNTQSRCFYRDGECTMVPMMELETKLLYAHVEDLRAHAVQLPYEGKRYSMILLVPLVKDGVDVLIRDLPFVGIPKILDLMHTEDVTLFLPRFTVNYNEDMVEALRKTRITSLFSNKANLSRIFEGTVPHVNNFYHKVFMSVDEAGTVAAAVSAVVAVPLMYTGEVQVTVDRPFVFFIRDNEQGVVLFEGKIEEPSISEYVLDVHAPIKSPAASETRKVVPTVQSSNAKPKTTSNSFYGTLKNFFRI